MLGPFTVSQSQVGRVIRDLIIKNRDGLHTLGTDILIPVHAANSLNRSACQFDVKDRHEHQRGQGNLIVQSHGPGGKSTGVVATYGPQP
jgi:hypothetical protein